MYNQWKDGRKPLHDLWSCSERTGRNPRTGETLVIPASKVPAFKVSSALKKAVNK